MTPGFWATLGTQNSKVVEVRGMKFTGEIELVGVYRHTNIQKCSHKNGKVIKGQTWGSQIRVRFEPRLKE